jgi:hypothetical protein
MRNLIFALLLLLPAVISNAQGRIIIVNTDASGVGFNDTTPATPVGGNNGTTLGQQRLNVFNKAAEVWQNALQVDVDILVSASFPVIAGCTESSAVLGQAAPTLWKHSFTGAPRQNVWYPIALANQYAGIDLEPAQRDIFVQFNSAVDNQTCLGASDWYYGFDRQQGNDIDLFVVVLHELAHGLGIAGATSSPGFLNNRPSVFNTNMRDRTLNLQWDQMSDAQRAISVVNTGNLVWSGDEVRQALAQFLSAVTTLTITEPSAVARNYDIGLASFGSDASKTALSGRVVAVADAADATGSSPTDGCTTLTNASAVNGNIALVDRGNCTFVLKAQNAQAAGATGLIVVDNTRTSCVPPGMGGTDDGSVTIPVVSISASDGDALKFQLSAQAQVRGTLRVDPAQRAGASQDGYVRLYAPCTIEPGSSTHHFDVVASPNLLMEPSINSDLLHGLDLTLYQLFDIGWQPRERTGRRYLRR